MHVILFVLTRDRCELLGVMLESIRAQVFRDFTCVVLDNGSTDETPELVARLQEQDQRFRLERWLEGRSAQENFDRAISIGSEESEWFAMLHDDDILQPGWLFSGIEAIRCNPDAKMVSINAKAFDSYSGATLYHWYPPKNGIVRLETTTDLVLWMMKHGSMNFPSILYSRNAFPREFRFEWPFGKVSDQYIILEAGKPGPVVAVLDPAYEYRIHSSQDSSSIPEEDVYAKCDYIVDHLPWRTNLGFRFLRNSFFLRNYIHFRKLKGGGGWFGWLRFLASREALLVAPPDIGRVLLLYLHRMLRRRP